MLGLTILIGIIFIAACGLHIYFRDIDGVKRLVDDVIKYQHRTFGVIHGDIEVSHISRYTEKVSHNLRYGIRVKGNNLYDLEGAIVTPKFFRMYSHAVSDYGRKHGFANVL